jgi:hypothetical protein
VVADDAGRPPGGKFAARNDLGDTGFDAAVAVGRQQLDARAYAQVVELVFPQVKARPVCAGGLERHDGLARDYGIARLGDNQRHGAVRRRANLQFGDAGGDDPNRRLGVLELGVGDGELLADRPQMGGLICILRGRELCTGSADVGGSFVEILTRSEAAGASLDFRANCCSA